MADEEEFWLVKVPNHVLKQWEQNTAPGAVIGTVSVNTAKRDEEGMPTLALSTQTADTAFPQRSPMEPRPTGTQQLVFARETAEGARFVGRVTRALDVRPHMDDSYQRVLETRIRKYTEPERAAKVLDSNEVNLTMAATNASQVHKRQKKEVADKRARMDRLDLVPMMHRLFDQKTHWTMKELLKATEQPASYLKEVLLEICEKHNQGPHIHTWSLKT